MVEETGLKIAGTRIMRDITWGGKSRSKLKVHLTLFGSVLRGQIDFSRTDNN